MVEREEGGGGQHFEQRIFFGVGWEKNGEGKGVCGNGGVGCTTVKEKRRRWTHEQRMSIFLVGYEERRMGRERSV